MGQDDRSIQLQSFDLAATGQPLVRASRRIDLHSLRSDEALIRIAGCGVCHHTDLGFVYDGVRTGSPLPLTLGHEIAGVVEAAGTELGALLGAQVVVPAVIPCGRCGLCAAGRGSICRKQIFPGRYTYLT